MAERGLLRVVWLLALCAAGCMGGADGGGGGDAGFVVVGAIGDSCEAPEDCEGVRYPECVDLDDEGQTRCQSVCDTAIDCSANADCIGSPSDGGGICLLPCASDGDCAGTWDCVLDQYGVGYCLPSQNRDGAPINGECEVDTDCAGSFASCYDWGDGVTRCSSPCVDQSDCGIGDDLCVQVDPDTGDALCFAQCADVSDCPDSWTCEEGTTSGKTLCLPPL